MPPGRPRSDAARDSILSATRDELTKNGFDRLSIDRVAAAAGVGKQTVYRWYPSKNALVADCLLQGHLKTPTIPLMRGGSVRDELFRWMRAFVEVTREPSVMALIRSASAAAAEDREIARAFREQMKSLARDSIVARIEEAIGAGEIRPSAAPTVIAEIIMSSLVYRLVTYEEVTDEFVEQLSTTLFAGIAHS